MVTTPAGTAGAAGSTDGAGATARFNSPCGVAIDASGNLYVGDKGNSAIRKMIPGPAPVTGVSPALAAGAGSLWFTASPSLTLTAGDAGGGVAQTWYRLDGGSWTQYTSALTPAGDGLHTLSYYSTAADGTAETTHAGYFGIDTTPPLTTATGLAAGATLDWHGSAASFTLVASDATSGPAATFYTIDSGSAQLYSGAPVLLGADGSYTITYWSVDIAGKVETPHTAYLNIDATPPSAISGLASATHPSQTTWYTNTTPGFGWSAATDAGSGVAGYACVLDQTSGTVPAATVTTEATSASFPSRADGTYYFHIRAVDNAGNGGPPSQYVVKIDSTPPSAISGLASATHPSQTTWYTNTTPGFGWSAATDAGSGVAGYACVLDQTSGTVPAATVTTEATSASFPSRADGTYYFHIRAVDNAGNGGPPSQYVVKIDSTPPITTAPGLASTAGSSWSSATPRPVSLAAGDTGSGLLATYYTLDSGGQQTYTSPLSISGEGLHTVTYWSLDTAGNIEQPHTGFVGIDTTPPTVSDNSDGAWHDAGVTVTLSPSDPGGSGIAKTQYRLQGSGTWLDTTADQFVAPAPSSSSNDGAQTYEYRAIDLAGNISASGSCTVKFDTTAPTTVASSSDGLALDGSTWHGGALTVTFAPTDPSDTHGTCSGVRSTQYSTDGGATWITGTSVTYPVWKRGGGSGSYTLLYRSTDWAGNTESQKSVPVLIDCTAPTTTESGADLAWHAVPVTVSFTAIDAGCGVASTHYRVDDGTWMIGTSVTIPAPAKRRRRRHPRYRLLLGRRARQHRSDARLHGRHRDPAAGHRRQRRHLLARGALHAPAHLVGPVGQRHHDPVQHRRRHPLADGQQRALHERLEAWRRQLPGDRLLPLDQRCGHHRSREVLCRDDRHLAADDDRRCPEWTSVEHGDRPSHLPRHVLGPRADLVSGRRWFVDVGQHGGRGRAGEPCERRRSHDPLLLDRQRRQRRGRLPGLLGGHRDAVTEGFVERAQVSDGL